jgi:hypothetical protein
MLSDASTPGRSRRPELVVLISHEVIKRGWRDVREGETCKIPGIGPVSPEVARSIAQDAFITGVFYDGKDLRHLRRWTRNIPIEVLVAWSSAIHATSTGRVAPTAASDFAPRTTTWSPRRSWPRLGRRPRTPLLLVP